MRVLITGSSGQIGTNLALRLQRDGHWVFGVDKRLNTWTRRLPDTLLQDLAGHYPAFEGGIGGVEYPEVDVVVHLAAHAKVHQLVAQPHRALENAIMTFNVLEYARALGLPLVFSSTREVYGDVHRFEEYAEEAADFAYTESPYSASKITQRGVHLLVRPLLRPRLPRLPLLERLRPLRQRPRRMERVLPLFMHQMCRGEPITVYGGEREGARLHLHRRLRRRHRARRLRARRAAGSTNKTINLAYGEGNTLVRAAELIAAELERRAADHDGAVARRRGDALRRRHHARRATCSTGSRRRRSTRASRRSVAWFREWRAAHPEEDRPFERPRTRASIEHGFKQPAGAGA